jgi:hypothetical protein
MTITIDIHEVVTIHKHPSSELDYIFDWSLWLGNDTIASSSWTVSTGLTKKSDSNTTTTATIWLTGGTDKNNYTISNTIITAGNRKETKELIVKVSSKGGS